MAGGPAGRHRIGEWAGPRSAALGPNAARHGWTWPGAGPAAVCSPCPGTSNAFCRPGRKGPGPPRSMAPGGAPAVLSSAARPWAGCPWAGQDLWARCWCCPHSAWRPCAKNSICDLSMVPRRSQVPLRANSAPQPRAWDRRLRGGAGNSPRGMRPPTYFQPGIGRRRQPRKAKRLASRPADGAARARKRGRCPGQARARRAPAQDSKSKTRMRSPQVLDPRTPF